MHAAIAVTAAACAVSAVPAAAQEKSAVRPGFALPADGHARILLFRPDITVGAQSTGGMFEPNADWTAQAREAIGAALAREQGSLGNSLTDYVEPVGADAAKLAEYRALFGVVAQSVIQYKFFPGNRLPTKKRKDVFDWTLGKGIHDLPGAENADYALFITTNDQFGSTGRKMFQVMVAMAGVGIQSGVHAGFAGLVDLKTGDLVWLNADLQMGGDVRTPEGAARRVQQLLEDFPAKPMAKVIVTAER